jgi:predicted amidohydrolase
VPIGLGSGICGAIRTRDLLGLSTEIIGVQSTEAPSYALSFAAGHVVETNSANTMADGMATRQPDAEALAIIRAGATLYCAALHIGPDGQLAGHRRKLMPTAAERLVWGQGGPEDVISFASPVGQIGAVICWENFMPLFRTALYGQGVTIWAAPTVDERPQWEAAMRHIAHEGRCFVVSACQYVPPSQTALGDPITLIDRPADAPLIAGGSLIVSPMGEVLAGPLRGGEGLIVAEVDLADIVAGVVMLRSPLVRPWATAACVSMWQALCAHVAERRLVDETAACCPWRRLASQCFLLTPTA